MALHRHLHTSSQTLTNLVVQLTSMISPVITTRPDTEHCTAFKEGGEDRKQGRRQDARGKFDNRHTDVGETERTHRHLPTSAQNLMNLVVQLFSMNSPVISPRPDTEHCIHIQCDRALGLLLAAVGRF